MTNEQCKCDTNIIMEKKTTQGGSEMQRKERIADMSINDMAKMELLFLQLAYDEMALLFNIGRIKENRRTIVPRAEVREAFNSAFKAIKRNLMQSCGEYAYTIAMDMMADLADELEAHVTIVRNAYLAQCCNKMAYCEYLPMAHTLTLETLLKMSYSIFKNLANYENRRIKAIISKMREFTDSYVVKMFAGNSLVFDTTEVSAAIERLLEVSYAMVRKYEPKCCEAV